MFYMNDHTHMAYKDARNTLNVPSYVCSRELSIFFIFQCIVYFPQLPSGFRDFRIRLFFVEDGGLSPLTFPLPNIFLNTDLSASFLPVIFK